MIAKSHKCQAEVGFVITSFISEQTCTTGSAISTLLYSFRNPSVTKTLLCLQMANPRRSLEFRSEAKNVQDSIDFVN